jgi:hypothetical protein
VISAAADSLRQPPWERAAVTLIAIAAAIAMAWWQPWQVNLNDYSTEAALPLAALLHGHILQFLRSAPSYGPSLELRAPFALIASLEGGSRLLIYRFSALPCLLALAALGAWIATRLRAAGRSRLTAALTLAVCFVNPMTYYAMKIGHPEEVLGGVLCVVAVLAALRGRGTWAGILLGLAIANKEWALVAIGPVLLALPARRIHTLLIAAAVTGVLLAPIALTSGSVKAASSRITVNDGGTVFYPQQIWWFLGTPGRWLPAMRNQILYGYRLPPSWLQGRAHELIVWIGLPLTWLAARRRIPRENALALLALLLLLRCMLDPWDLVYYPLPFAIALLSWETLVRGRAPIGAAAVSAAAWAIFEYLPLHLSANQTALSFLIPSVCALAAIAFVVYRRPPAEVSLGAVTQATTRSSLVKRLSRVAPSSVSTTRSSIRTPSVPGR